MIQYFPIVTGSLTVLGNINVSGSITTSGSITISGSITSASFAATASFIANAESASYVLTAQTASFVALAQSASNAVSAATASFANTLTVAGNLTAQTLVVQTITSSVDFVTGSTRFGSILDNTHVFTGSMNLTGSLTVITNGTEFQVTSTGVKFGNVIGDAHSITGSMLVTGSIGVGTLSPTSPLSLYFPSTASDVNYIKIEMPSWGGSTNYKKNIIWHDSGNVVGGIGMSFTSPYTYMDFHSFYNNAHTTGSLMRIQGNGYVGIGTTSPNTLLTVRGTPTTDYGSINAFDTRTAAIDQGPSIAFGGFITGTSSGGTFGLIGAKKENATAGNEAGYISFNPNNGSGVYPERLRINSTGDLVFKQSQAIKTGPGSYMAIYGGGGGFYFGGSEANQMLLTSGGNLLIGTLTDIGHKLQVNGTTNSSNYRTINNGATIPGSSTATILTLSNSATGVYIVNANFGGQGNQIYGGMLIIVANAGSFRIVTNGSGSSCSLTLSGNNVQITNPIGAPLDATANAILIGNT
jgi:hypothetical protein